MNKIQLIKPCSALASLYISAASYKRDSFQSEASVVSAAYRALYEALRSDVLTHLANVPAIDGNRAIRAQVTAMMRDVGIPESWSERYQPRAGSRYKFRTKTPGYLEDLAAHCPVDDGWSGILERYAMLKREYDKYAAEVSRKAEEASKAIARQEEIDKAKRKDDLALAALILRYGLKEDATWRDAREHILDAVPILGVAVAMSDVRHDFHLGPRPVFAACNRVDELAATDQERAIIRSVRDVAENWDGDGRIFRDCEWNPDTISKTIEDQRIVDDLWLAHSKASS